MKIYKNKIWMTLLSISTILGVIFYILFYVQTEMITHCSFYSTFEIKLEECDVERGDTYYVILSESYLKDPKFDIGITNFEKFSDLKKLQYRPDQVYYGRFTANSNQLTVTNPGDSLVVYDLVKSSDITTFQFIDHAYYISRKILIYFVIATVAFSLYFSSAKSRNRRIRYVTF